MKYMLLCYDDEQAWAAAGKPALQAAMDEAVRLTHELDAKGQYLGASPLHPVSMATSVRVRDGKRLVTDGPFAETREQLGGYYLIDVGDLDEAIRVAGRHPGARLGSVEIRPVFELPGLPDVAEKSARSRGERKKLGGRARIALWAGAALLLLLGVTAIVAAMQPDDFRVSRTAAVAAPVRNAFDCVNDFHRWTEWSPYEKLDPGMQRTYDGAQAGVGAVYAWNGNNEVGEGSSTIIESRSDELIRIQLEFVRPFACKSLAEFSFEPRGDRTQVTWTLIGQKCFVAKALGLFMSMDRMVGDDFERGLASLKEVVERGPSQ